MGGLGKPMKGDIAAGDTLTFRLSRNRVACQWSAPACRHAHTNYCSLWPVDVGRRTHVIRIATAWPVDGRPPRVATLIRIIAARGSVDVGRRTHVLRIATAWPVDGRPPRVATSYPNAHSKRAGGAPGGTRCADRRQGHR
jgi:hypothetical protein